MPVSHLRALEICQAFDNLRTLLGYVQNGSDTKVTIQQDDATGDWILNVGNRRYYASNLELVLHIAAQDQNKREESI